VVGLAIVVDVEGHSSALLPKHDLVADVIFVVDGSAIQGHNHFHIVRLVRNHVNRAIISILSSNAANGKGQIQADPPHSDLTW
jgi:hypothetical protein